MKDQWFKPLIKIASELGAGMGFFAHAFPDFVLEDSTLYNKYKDVLFDNLVELNNYAHSVGCGKLGIEQMYAPQHYPWRIKDVRELLKTVSERSVRDFYFTEDLGHHHNMFLKPEKLGEKLNAYLESLSPSGLWLGVREAYELFDQAKGGDDVQPKIEKLIDENPHMFTEHVDCDCYAWLSQLGAYSPIIHLQQTNGLTSSHWAFTQEFNSRGIITPQKVLKAIKQSYDTPQEENMPQKVDKIYLTLEIFTPTASINYDTLRSISESASYWREFIVEDGMTLDEVPAIMEEIV